MANIVIMPDGNRYNLDSMLSWSLSSATITFNPSNGGAGVTYVAPNSQIAQMVMTQIDAFFFEGSNGSVNISDKLGPVLINTVSPLPFTSTGGDAVTITGKGFQNGAQIIIGGVILDPAGYSIVVVSSTSITFNSPDGTLSPWPGLVSEYSPLNLPITVKNPDGTSFELDNEISWV